MRSPLALLALAALGAAPAAAQSEVSPLAPAPASGGHATQAPTATAVRATGPVRVDGRLDDAAWAAATPLTRFTQVDPDEGVPASEETEARILVGDDALYVGVRLHDRGRVSTRLGRRDMPLGDADWVGVVIDSYHDHRTAYSFDINPSGVRRDAFKTDAGDDLSWDPVWEGAATQDAEGWTAEYRIPFSQLRFAPGSDPTWGIQVERVIARRREYAVIAFTPRTEAGGIASYAHLRGLGGVQPGRRLELLPYTVARAEHVDPGANPFRTDREYGAALGLDLKYRLTTDLTLDATVNPDFGQVEQDPAEVNLTAFESYFQERRPFFVAGADRFGFGGGALGPGGSHANLFYSRRIGRRPQLGSPAAASDVPGQTTILGAAKLSGRTAAGWSVGVLGAATGREEARFREEGLERTAAVEPLTGYVVARAGREMRAGQTALGVMATAVQRDLDDDRLREGLRSAAYAGGVDFRHAFARRTWRVSGYLAGSHVRGSSSAITAAQRSPLRYLARPDAAHLELDPDATSLSGWAGQLQLAKESGLHWRGDAGVHAVSPGYEVNDLGFQTRADQVGANYRVSYREDRPGRFLRRWNVTHTGASGFNFAGDHVANSFFVGSTWQALNYWSVNLNAGYSLPRLDDRLTRGGPIARRPGDWRVLAGISSDSRRRAHGGVTGYYGEDEGGSSLRWVRGTLALRPSTRWNLTVGPYLERAYNPAQYVATVADGTDAALFGRRYLFAPLEQTTLSLETRLNLTFTPDLSLEVFAQPFVSAGDFGGLARLRAPRTYDFVPSPETPLADQDPRGKDFNVRSLRGNAVLRWEWRPGSTMYLAWQQSRESAERVGEFDFARDRRALFGTRPDNVFVLKVSYWVNP